MTNRTATGATAIRVLDPLQPIRQPEVTSVAIIIVLRLISSAPLWQRLLSALFNNHTLRCSIAIRSFDSDARRLLDEGQ
jgi:hypothetical protein